MEIDTGNNPPIKVRGRPHSPPKHEAIRKFIDEGLEEGIIEPSDSPWSAPLLLAPKKDGALRVCVDYCTLNRVTKKNAYPLPCIDDCYQYLVGAKFFTTLDLRSGYWQVRLSDRAKPKTAFTCRYGHFQFCVMPFGLCNAPAVFQTMINDILCDFIDRFVMVYLDDIIIYSATWDDHVRDVLAVLKRLQEHDLVLNGEKCSWAQLKILYLGHVVSGDGIQPNPTKIQVIISWPRPSNITQVRGFLNISGYYCCFIQGFARIASPLYDLLHGAPKKCLPIVWTDECEKAWNLDSPLLNS